MRYLFTLLGFLASGWFFALYFALQPGFEILMSEVSDGTFLNVVPPSIYLVFGVVIILFGFCFDLISETEAA